MVSTFEDELKWKRKKASVVTFIIIVVLGSFSALGFNVLSNVTPMKLDLLSFFDFLTNSVMMPLAAIFTCVLILRVVKINKIEEEVMVSSKFRLRGLYRVVLKFVAIPFLIIILISSICGTLASSYGIKALEIFII